MHVNVMNIHRKIDVYKKRLSKYGSTYVCMHIYRRKYKQMNVICWDQRGCKGEVIVDRFGYVWVNVDRFGYVWVNVDTKPVVRPTCGGNGAGSEGGGGNTGTP